MIAEISPTADTIRLTEFSSCAGCAAKIGQKNLAGMLHGLPFAADPNLLIGAATSDDAGVYRLDADRALVQTLDFFTPIVDDPYDFGRIAATNALSDVYAMGGRPMSAMNIVGMPESKLPPQVIRRILLGGADVVRSAPCCLLGGHSIRSLEPLYGLSVTGMVHPDRLITNSAARAGDLLLLTKPLGTGIITTAIKRRLASPDLINAAINSMCTLNTPGAELAETGLITAGTDVTGFGLTGHLANICRGSGVGAELFPDEIPLLGREVLSLIDQDCIPGGTRTNYETACEYTDWHLSSDRYRILLSDAQTSGPLLLCVRPDRRAAVEAVLQKHGALCSAVIGRIVSFNDKLIRLI